jgi:hypothetical protein
LRSLKRTLILSVRRTAALNVDNGLLSITIHPPGARKFATARAVWIIEPGDEQQIEGGDSMALAVQDFKHRIATGTVRPTSGEPFRQASADRTPGVDPDRRGVFVGTNALGRPASEHRGVVVTMAGLAG